jgi:hypothetical protein
MARPNRDRRQYYIGAQSSQIRVPSGQPHDDLRTSRQGKQNCHRPLPPLTLEGMSNSLDHHL